MGQEVLLKNQYGHIMAIKEGPDVFNRMNKSLKNKLC